MGKLTVGWMVVFLSFFAHAESGSLPVVPPARLGEDVAISQTTTDDELALVDAARLVNEESKEKANEAKTTAAQALKESEIPAFKNEKAAIEKVGSSYLRLAISFAIVLATGLAVALFGRWWSRKYRRNELNTQIRVMTQHHLGPRKSLAIVRVAGEYILLGITDHNISMIKTLSLIDDEFETGTKFSDSLVSLEEFDSDQAESTSVPPSRTVNRSTQDEFSFADVKDVVARKLREMRSL